LTRGYLWVIFAGKCFNAMEKEKTIEIIAPEGYEVDKEKSSFEKIVFRALPDKGLPRRWEELGLIHGSVVTTDSGVSNLGWQVPSSRYNRRVWPTREEAEASIALAQLCQLRDRYNGGWKPNWGRESDELKHCVNIECGKITANIWRTTQHVLTFKTPELRDKFMENFSDLIEKAKPLLG